VEVSAIDRDAQVYLDEAMLDFGRVVGRHACPGQPELVIEIDTKSRWMWCHDCEWRVSVTDMEWLNEITPRIRNIAMERQPMLVSFRTAEIRQEVMSKPPTTRNIVDLTADAEKAAENKDRETAIRILAQIMDPRYQGGNP
jgi:hypothetical protein